MKNSSKNNFGRKNGKQYRKNSNSNSYITNEIFLMEVLADLITIKIGDKDEYEVYMNSQIKPREGN